ncbi:hypothetical protein Ancab_001146, partial [Ancistrocladus abbreviatus]
HKGGDWMPKICRKFHGGYFANPRQFSILPVVKPDRPTFEDYACRDLGAATPSTAYLRNLLQMCAKYRLVEEGEAYHCQIIKGGLQADTIISNILVNMYWKCGVLQSAQWVFDEMSERSLVSWNTIIGACTHNGLSKDAFTLFVKMQKEMVLVSEFTVSSVICACAAKGAIFECRQLHALAIKLAMDLNVFVGTALLDVYAKCYFVKDATRVFDSIEEKSEVTFSSMVAGYVRSELYEEALMLYRKVHMIGLEQNQFTISSILSACAGLAALIEGSQMHAVSCKVGFDTDIFVCSSLIDMYARCGSIGEAYNVFSNQEHKNVVLWNAMLSGFSRHGRWIETVILFEKMQQMGFSPDEVTYVSLLSVCGHMGLVEEGRKYFDIMVCEHYVSPNVLHYSCLVDILGRAGLIQEAYNLIGSMPFEATASVWGSFLGSCRKYGNLELAEIAAKHLFKIEPSNAGNHVLLSDIYAVNQKWEEVARSRKTLKESEVKKEKGKSWIEIKDKVHIFMVGERNHPQIAEIYFKLDELIKEMEKLDYKAQTEHDFHDVEERKKEELLRHHSEKLALTFGVMHLPPGAPVRIMKNLRICGDCHSFMKFASKITGRLIIVRDVNRFHHFKNGFCSCGDFW